VAKNASPAQADRPDPDTTTETTSPVDVGQYSLKQRAAEQAEKDAEKATRAAAAIDVDVPGRPAAVDVAEQYARDDNEQVEARAKAASKEQNL
jgi:hypothetical protein